MFVKNLCNYDPNTNNDKFKNLLIEISTDIYNIINSNDIHNMSEENYNNLINKIKLLKMICTKSFPNFKEEIVNYKINNEQNLYEVIIELFFSLEKNKLELNKTQFLKVKEKINSPEVKHISYNDLINLTSNINEDANINKENILIKELYEYCIWCHFSLKSNKEEKLKYIFDKCKEIKNIEKENITSINSVIKNNDNNEGKIIRKKYKKYTGLKNIATTCYLNSVIQILFMIPEFRFLILSLNDNKEKIKGEYLDDDNTFHQLQKLFTYMLLISDPFVIPREFFLSLKDPNSYLFSDLNGQKDSQEFFLYLCDKIESLIKGITKERFLIKNFFGGKLCNLMKCPNCRNISTKFEEFISISLEVEKFKNIEESLDKFISSEKVKDYECSKCNKKVTLKIWF